MERLSVKEIRVVITALEARREALQARLDQGDLDEDAAGDVAEDLLLCGSLIQFFENERNEELARSKREVGESFDLESIRLKLESEQ